MTDPDQTGEELDESLGGEYPPDHAPHLDDDGGLEPEAWEESATRDDESVELLGDPDIEVVDDEKELVGGSVENDPAQGPLAPDDEISGDETTRDFATENVRTPAEEAAVHIDDEAES